MRILNESLVFLILFLGTLSFASAQEDTPQKTVNENIRVQFTGNMEYEDLEEIKEQMDEKGITLEYLDMDFNSRGKLKALEFTVDFNDGFSGSYASKWITRFSNFGFYRNYSSNSGGPFGVGKLP